jgi:hypothetical protein
MVLLHIRFATVEINFRPMKMFTMEVVIVGRLANVLDGIMHRSDPKVRNLYGAEEDVAQRGDDWREELRL